MRLRLAIALLAVFAGLPATGAELRIAYGDTGFAPFSFREGEAKLGIYDRLIKAIAAETGDSFRIAYLPQNRKYRAFEEGRIDIEPGVNPEWRERWKDVSVYSEPFMEVEDVLISQQDVPPFRAPEELIGKSLGTQTGYSYPELEAFFKDGRIRRDDAADEQTMIAKLAKKRIDAGVLWRTIAEWHLRNDPQGARFSIGGSINAKSVHFRFRAVPELKEALDRFNRALVEFKANGRMKAIFDEYR